MKKKYFAATLLALILTACGSENVETEETDIVESSVNSQSVSIVTEISDITDETVEQATESSDITEVQTSDSVVEATENEKAFGSYIDLSEFSDEGYYTGSFGVSGGDILIVKYCFAPNGGTDAKSDYIAGISLDDKSQLFRIDAPSSDFYFSDIISDGKNGASIFMTDRAGENSNLIEFDTRGGHTITENVSSDDYVYSWGDRAVKCVNGSIVDASDGTVLCPRTDEEDDPYFVKSKTYRFGMPLDNDRFLVNRVGYEWADGVEIYDFRTNTLTELPDSAVTTAFGVHNGLIYTVDCFDGVCTNIYTYDPDEPVKKDFCGSPFELQMNDMIYYQMPEDGSFIAAVYSPFYENDAEPRFVILDSDTGNIIDEYAVPDINIIYPPFFSDSYMRLLGERDIVYYTEMPKENFKLDDTGDTVELSLDFLGNKKVISSYDKSISWNPDQYEMIDFTNVLGYNGVKFSTVSEAAHSSYNAYIAVIKGEPVCIAESFGYGISGDDYSADIDGDEENEFICNCLYGADGVRECRIYKRFGNDVRTASGTDLIPEEILMKQSMATNVYSEYDPERNIMICGYVDNGETVTKEYGADEMTALKYDGLTVSLNMDE